MSEERIALLERALDRQKKARMQAERILEAKSKELYDTARQLGEANDRLEDLLREKTSELQGVFVNIVDPYVVMDLEGNVLRMNAAAKKFLGFDYEKQPINLGDLIHPDFQEYTAQSLNQLFKVGSLKNYKARIIDAHGNQPFIQVNSSVIYDKDNTPIAAQGIIRDITREKEASELIQEQKRQLDIIVDHSPLAIVLIANGKIIRSNARFSEMTGYSSKEITNQPISDFAQPLMFGTTKSLMQQMDKGEIDQFTVDKVFRRKDGTAFDSKTSVSAVRNPDGSIGYLVGMIEDITLQREAELKIKASENRLSNLIENLSAGVLLEDHNGRIAFVNPRFCELFGIDATLEAMIGTNAMERSDIGRKHFKDSESFVARKKAIVQARKKVQNEELELKDGRILERDFIPIFVDDTYQGHLWTYTDVTLQKHYRRNLEQEKEKYSSIIANMNMGLMEVDMNDTIQLVNQSMSQMSGYSPKELIGKRASEVFRVEPQERDGLEKRHARRKQGQSDSYEIRVLTKDHSRRIWLVSAAPRYDETGTVVGTIGIHLDITGQKELEVQKEKLVKELQASNHQLSEYAHIVSHDLKSPLRSINALASWLREDNKGVLSEESLFNLQLMEEKIEGMDRLINGILQYSSIRQDTSKLVSVDLNEVVCHIRQIIYIPEHVQVVIMDTLPEVKANQAQMHQLFQNLLSNAVTHIENPEGLVQVGFRETKGFWEFYVRDNGTGIPKEYHSKIFEIFQSIRPDGKGTGIGLSIVKKITELHGGRVWLESSPEAGTTFYFTLSKI